MGFLGEVGVGKLALTYHKIQRKNQFLNRAHTVQRLLPLDASEFIEQLFQAGFIQKNSAEGINEVRFAQPWGQQHKTAEAFRAF